MNTEIGFEVLFRDFTAVKQPDDLSYTTMQIFGPWNGHNEVDGVPSYLTQPGKEGSGLTHTIFMPLWELTCTQLHAFDTRNEDGQLSFRPLIVVPNPSSNTGFSYYTVPANIYRAIETRAARVWRGTGRGNFLRHQDGIPGYNSNNPNNFMTLANSVQHAGAILYEGATKYRMINADGEVYYNWAGKTGD